MYSKFKDREPIETVNLFYQKLASLGLDIKFDFNKISDCVYSCRAECKNINFGTNGKGTTEVYSLASGLGEMIERIQCNLVPNFSKNYDFPDKKFINSNKFFEDNKNLLESFLRFYSYGMEKSSKENLLSFLNEMDLAKEGKIECVPFYYTKTKEIRYLPLNIIKLFVGSNGASAGNTREECLVQAMSEIIERWAMFEVIEKKLTPPLIDNNWLSKHSPENFKRLVFLKEKTGLSFFVYDLSLGKKLPCLALVAVDKNNKNYIINPGSHPIFDIALERCITEMFQGVSEERMNLLNFKSNSIFEDNRISNKIYEMNKSFSCGKMKLDYSFFSKESSWNFKDWEIKETVYNNKFGAKYLISLIEEYTNDGLYIKDMSFLGIPTFFVYSAKISSVLPINEKIIAEKNILSEMFKVNSKKVPSFEDKIKFLNFLKNPSMDILEIYDINLLVSALLFDLGRYNESLFYLKGSSNLGRDCIVKEIEMIKENYSLEERNRYLRMFFGESDIDFLNKKLRKGEAFANLMEDYRLKTRKNNGEDSFFKTMNSLLSSSLPDQILIKNIIE